METLTFGGTNYISTPSKGRHRYKNCSFYGQKVEEVASKRKNIYQGCCPTGLPGGLLLRSHPLISLGSVCASTQLLNYMSLMYSVVARLEPLIAHWHRGRMLLILYSLLCGRWTALQSNLPLTKNKFFEEVGGDMHSQSASSWYMNFD